MAPFDDWDELPADMPVAGGVALGIVEDEAELELVGALVETGAPVAAEPGFGAGFRKNAW